LGVRRVGTWGIRGLSSNAGIATTVERQGYAIIPDFLSESEIGAMRERAEQLRAELGGKTAAEAVFSTIRQEEKTDSHFLSSGDKISAFFEEEHKELNKLGHALHDLDPVFEQVSYSDKVKQVATEFFTAPAIVQSMYIFKLPRVGAPVVPHQDNTFLYTDPAPTCVGFWMAIDDAHRGNGCLWAAPGSHLAYPLSRRFVRTGDDKVAFRDVPGVTARSVPDSEFIPVEVPKGTLVVLHGSLVHRSFLNESENPRHAYTLHMVEQSPVRSVSP